MPDCCSTTFGVFLAEKVIHDFSDTIEVLTEDPLSVRMLLR
jgi:hypothetical protein